VIVPGAGAKRRAASVRCGLLVCVVGCVLPAAALAQGAAESGGGVGGLLKRPARLQVRAVALDVALMELERRSGVPMALSPGLMAGRGPVSCQCATATVREALDSLLTGTGFGYIESSTRVIVLPAPRADVAGARTSPGAAAAASRPPPRPVGTLVVEVTGEADSQPVSGAEVHVSGRFGAWRADGAGRARLALAPGTYEVAVRALGYAPVRVPDVAIRDGASCPLAVRLAPTAIALSEVVVTPGTYGLLAEERTASTVTLAREEVEAAPHVNQDVYRAVNRLPGVVSGDLGARLEVRGAPNDQLLVLLDGLELHEPFHFKDMDGGLLGIVDVESVADVSLVTAGFSAEHGDRLGGVLTMRTITPTRTSTILDATLRSLAARSQGVFAAGRGAWLVGARRSVSGPIVNLVNVPASSSLGFQDAIAKVQYQLGSSHLVSGHFLYGGDRFSNEEHDGTRTRSRHGSGYAWLNWTAGLGRGLSAHTVLSAARITRRRYGSEWADETTKTLDVVDRATFESAGLSQDWSLEASARWLVKWGYEFRRARASYDYSRWCRWWEPNLTDPAGPTWYEMFSLDRVSPRPSGSQVGLYVASRVRPVDALTAEAGLRLDQHSHTGDRALSPRFNLAWQVGPGVTLRSAWGFYYQAQGLPYLAVTDLDTLFQSAQRAEHRVVGLEGRLARSTTVRIEAYERLVRDPWPEYRNLQTVAEPVPEEGPWDRVRVAPERGRARGAEILVRREPAGPVSWSASYALAASEDEIAGAWVPRPHDQRHTVRAELAWRPGRRWALTGAWQYHSPWPVTQYSIGLDTTATGVSYPVEVPGPMNGGRLPAYHRLDARVTREFQLGRGRLSLYLDVFNLYDRRNNFAYESGVAEIVGNRVVEYRQERDVVGRLHTIGARWEF